MARYPEKERLIFGPHSPGFMGFLEEGHLQRKAQNKMEGRWTKNKNNDHKVTQLWPTVIVEDDDLVIINEGEIIVRGKDLAGRVLPKNGQIYTPEETKIPDAEQIRISEEAIA